MKQFHPDVVILDAGLSDMGAADFTSAVLGVFPDTGVILLCTDEAAAASQVILALEAGAFDFVLKPAGRCVAENTAPLHWLLLQKMRCFSIRRYVRIVLEKMLAQFGIAPARLRLDWVAAGEAERFQQVANDMADVVKSLGPPGPGGQGGK